MIISTKNDKFTSGNIYTVQLKILTMSDSDVNCSAILCLPNCSMSLKKK